MTKTFFAKISLLACIPFATTLAVACQGANNQQSRVHFVKTSTTKARLEKRDLTDKFMFGLNVIETKGFFSTALNLNFRPVEADLVLAPNENGKNQLTVSMPSRNGRREKL
ncbi:hypothetical protein EBR21_10390, partial [bacterium]|nr:hypothetical protein [bacterium]